MFGNHSRNKGGFWAFGLVSTVLTLNSLMGCRGSTDPQESRSVVIILERTRSPEGFSPEYTVTLHGSGLVEYVGNFGVDVPGSQAAKVDPSAILDLLKNADDINFFGIQDSYFEMCTDLPTTIISIRANGKVKRISNYYGGCERQRNGAQVDLAKLAEKTDTVAGTTRWVKCDFQCLANSIHTGLNINSQSSSGETALIVAIRRRDLAKVVLLLNAGANFDLGNNEGVTPLMWAVMTQQPDVVRELLKRGADMNARDARGFTAFQMTGDRTILRLLVGAKGKGR